MTHEELLAKLWILPADVTELQHGAKAVQALRSVVQLHKPYSSMYGLACYECEESQPHPYPCPTVQAIKKALS